MPRLLRVAVLFAFALTATFAGAQSSYPNRSIKLVVPYPPGALTDLLARAIGERLGAALKEPVVVDNKPGAGTLVGAEFVAKQPADGYTLLMATSTTLGISPALYQPSPINPVTGLRADLAGRDRQLLPDCEPRVSSEERQGDARCDQGESGQVQLRIGRQRQPAPSVHGSAEE